jgi:Mg-chelatase subunit ChlD
MGGSTPLASALACAMNIASRARRQGTERIELIVFTDGRANVALRGSEVTQTAFNQTEMRNELGQLSAALQQAGVSTVIVDTQNRFTSGGEGHALAEQLNARYVYLTGAEQLAAQL